MLRNTVAFYEILETQSMGLPIPIVEDIYNLGVISEVFLDHFQTFWQRHTQMPLPVLILDRKFVEDYDCVNLLGVLCNILLLQCFG